MTITETPLTGDQYIKLRKHHRAKWFVVPNPNPVKFKAQVNQASFPIDFAQIIYDNVTIGTYEGVKEGWVVFLSHTDNIHAAYFRGRVRDVPGSATFFINENSAPVADNDYIFVVKDTPLMERLPHKTGANIHWDWDRVYEQLPPVDLGLPAVAVGRLIAGGYVDFSFTPQSFAPTSGDTITDHLWDTDGGTLVDCVETDEDVTIRFDAPGWYEVRHTIIDSGFRTNYFAIRVVVYPADYSSMIAKSIICDEISEEGSIGWTARMRATSGNDLVAMLDQTEVVVISEDWFTRVRGSLVSNVKFIGRIRRDDAQTSLAINNGGVTKSRQTQIEVEGIGAQLSRLMLASVTLRRKTVATVLGEVEDLTLWRGMMFLASILTTLTTIYPLDFDDKSDDYAYPIFTAQDRSAESALADVAFTINAFFNFFPNGRMKIARHMHYLSADDKAALTTIASFDNRDWSALSVKRDRVPRLGRVIGYGGSFNTVSRTTIALRAKAPAVVWGPGEGRSQLNRQVLKANLSLTAAKEEVALRTGAEYASKNLVYTLETTHPSGYDNVLSISSYQRYTHTILETDNIIGFSCGPEKFWWLQRVQIRWDAVGNRTSTTASWVEDITGINAQVMAEIAPEDRPASIPSLPPFVDTPFSGLDGLQYVGGPDIDPEDEQPFDEDDAKEIKPPTKTTDPDKPTPTPDEDPKSRAGSVVAVANTSSLWICDDFTLKASPTWKNITPGSTIRDFKFDPFTGGGWCLTTDGVNSQVWRADNILNPVWYTGATLSGIYTQLRAGASTGGVTVYSPKLALYEPCPDPDPFTYGIITDTSEFEITIESEFTGSTNTVEWGNFPLDNTYCCMFRIEFTGIVTSGQVYSCTGVSISFLQQIDQAYEVQYWIASSPAPFSVKFIFPQYRAATRSSTDLGITFAAAVDAGEETALDAGFASTATLYAATDEIVRANSGAGYSSLSGASTPGSYARSLLPYSTGLLMASGAAVSGATLWIVSGAKTSITPTSGVAGLSVSPQDLAAQGDHIWFVANFGGTVKLARSVNAGSSWAFTTLDAGAKAVRAKNAEQVYIANNSSVAYSEDSGAALVMKTSPATTLILIEVR